MVEFSRRSLLGSALGAAGYSAAVSLLPANLRRVISQPVRNPGSLDEIKHVVILMQENRSFDHYFGTMRGVRGFDDPTAATLSTGRSIFYQPDAKNPDGYMLPFHLDTKSTSSQAIPSTSHAWSVQHASWNGGKMDNWLPAHRKADGEAHGPYTMGYYERADIPFHFALAEAFTICDNYHCSVLGPTWPNRLYLFTGTIDPSGKNGGPITSNVVPSPYRWTTYPERLTKAGISWHVYQEEDDYGCNPLEFFQSYQDASVGDPHYDHGLTIAPADRFAYDALHDRLPTVSWIIPTSPQCEHPDYLPATGADFLAQRLDAVAANPDVWRKTVFVINYDENDGLFDHVIPPTAPPGTPDEYVDGLPIGGGIRVPCIIVSPWTQGGFVASEPFDHTSVLRLLERITGVRETNITDWRRQTFGDLTSALGFPVSRPFPALPATKPEVWQAEHEVATLPKATFPGADQTPPHQETVAAASAAAAPAAVSDATTGALPGARFYGRSRVVENATTARGDFPQGTGGTNFPGLQDAVADAGPTTGTHVYAATIVSYSIVVVDPASHKLVASIDAGTNPYGITRAAGGKLYVSNSGASDVSVFNTGTGKITGSITVGLFPHGIATSPDGRNVYVANTGPDTGPGGSQSLSVIDSGSDKVAATWQNIGLAPHSIATSPDGRTLYVTCYDGLSVVDAGSGAVGQRVAGQGRANGVAAHPDGSRIYVVNTWQNTLSVLDTKAFRVLAQVPVAAMPWQVAVSPNGAQVYVTSSSADVVSVLDAANNRITATVPVHHVPTGITATADTIWVSTNAASTIDAIDAKTLKVVGSAPLGLSSEPAGIVVA